MEIKDRTYKNTLLDSIIKQVDEKSNVYIGADSGFFYIGRPDPKKIEKEMEKLKKEQETRAKSYWKKVLYYRDECNRLIDAEDSEALTTAARTLMECARAHKQSTSYIKHYKPYARRMLQRSYKSPTDRKGIILIVRGNEIGRYWTLEEFKERKGRKDESED